ncbi:MAG TPA: hypothetical protein VG797_03730, partial [Phycisphaerales bacterium]|nr:hypothetical protein [Phycisphaerales bacterium]
MTCRGLAITFAFLTAIWMQFACPCRAYGLSRLFDSTTRFAAPCHTPGDCTCHTHGADDSDSDNHHAPPAPPPQ